MVQGDQVYHLHQIRYDPIPTPNPKPLSDGKTMNKQDLGLPIINI
jgi:hypothetical protein